MTHCINLGVNVPIARQQTPNKFIRFSHLCHCERSNPVNRCCAQRTKNTVFDSPCDIQQNKITPLSQGIFILAVPCGAWLSPPLQNLQVQTGVHPPALLLRVEPQPRCSILHVTYNKIKIAEQVDAFYFGSPKGN